MTLAANALQAGIYSRLTSQLPTTSVYDHVVQGAAFPYVRIGHMTATPWDTKSNDGQEYTINIHVFTKAAGKKTLQALMASVYAALHHQETAITVSGFNLVLIRCEYTDADVEPQSEVDTDHYQHGVMRFRVLVQG